MDKKDIICFYHEYEEYGCFSNWYSATFEYAGKVYNSVEQYMMYQKVILFREFELADEIMTSNKPSEIKKLGRSKMRYFDSELWDKISYTIVKRGIRAKFQQNQDICKFISLILRHKPEVIGITLDEHGWAQVDELIAGISKSREFSMDMLEEIVRTDSKQRYSFNEDKTLIRANQGHSIPVDVELEKRIPPDVLWHGTGEKYVESINKVGLIPKSRLYVHLSKDYNTAKTVGGRHGKPVVYQVDTKAMAEDGYSFYFSVNGVWLTKVVPVQYLHEETN